MNTSNELSMDRDNIYLTEVQKQPSRGDGLESGQNKIQISELMKQYFVERRSGPKIKKPTPECDEHCLLNMKREEQDRLLSGLG